MSKQKDKNLNEFTTIRILKKDHKKLKLYAVLNELSIDEAFANLVKDI